MAARRAPGPAGRHARSPSRSSQGRGPGRHVAPVAAPRAAAANQRAASQPYGAAAGSPVQVARPQPVVVEPLKPLQGAPRVLIAEFLACLALIAAKPFEKVHSDAKFTEGTIGQLAAIMILFFLLALFGGVSPRTQKVANLFGGLVTLGLLFKNTEVLASVTNAIAGNVKGKAPAGETAPETQPGGIAPTPSGAFPEPLGTLPREG